MSAHPEPPGAGSRADARRNHALVLAAAQRAFAERGTSVSLAEIARRAGVGAGTVYRHFPTKSHLLEAVLQHRVDRLAQLAIDYRTAPDAGAAFFDFCAEVVTRTPGNQALCDLVSSDDGWPRALLQGAGARFHQALGDLLRTAQHQGAVRPDLTLADVLALFTGCVAIQQLPGNNHTLAHPARLVLDAMRATPGTATVTKLKPDPRQHNETQLRNETNPGTHCPICSTQIPRTGTGRPARYCSPACRQKAHRRRDANRRRDLQQSAI